jgi:hypothetical protein
MDANIITIATGVGVLVGIYATVNRTEDRINRRMDDRFTGVNTRFDDLRDLWRAELRRVEEVLDARLKHLEERVK